MRRKLRVGALGLAYAACAACGVKAKPVLNDAASRDAGLDGGSDAGGTTDAASEDEALDAGRSPMAPPHPVDGEQRIVRVVADRACVDIVETAIGFWAVTNGLLTDVTFRSPLALDINLLPERHLAHGARASKEAYSAYKEDCLLFIERYATDPMMSDRLRIYLQRMRSEAEAIEYGDLVALGFSQEDAHDLWEHLAECMDGPPLWGIEYFRVTYSFAPRKEFSINVGTVHRHRLSALQRRMFNALGSVVQIASRCVEP